MRIKRTFAPTMRDALQLVKQEQGPDAVILGNKKVPGGVEILSAIDFDEAAVANMASVAPAPRRELQVVESTAVHNNDVASDAWIGTILNDGRREPTLGPVADGQAAAKVQTAPAAVAKQASVAAIKPAPVKRPNDAEVRAAVARSRAKSRPAAKVAAKQTAAGTAAKKPVARKAAVAKPKSAPARTAVEKPAIDEVKVELQNLRDLMESQLSVLQWDRFSQKHPVRTVLLNLMSEMGLGVDVCDTVMSHLGELSDDPHKVWQR